MMSAWSELLAAILIYYMFILRSLLCFRPVCCRLDSDNIDVYSMSIHFKFSAIHEIDTIILQCSRLLNGRDFSSFSSQSYPFQDIEIMRTNAEGINELVISSLLKGTLYHCLCISQNSANKYIFKSSILSTSTKKDVTLPPKLQSMLSLIKSDNDKSIKLRWNPLAQDVNKLNIEISNSIPPKWNDYQIKVEGDVAALFQHDIGITNFNDGQAYSIRIIFSNQNGTGYSNVLSFVVPFIYLENIDVRASSNIEMTEITPTFHRKIYCYAIMVAQNCKNIQFGITPIDNIRNIDADSIKNGTTKIDKISNQDNQEIIDKEKTKSNTIDMTKNNENLLKSDEEIEEEINEMIDGDNNNENIKNEDEDKRLGMDNYINAETQSFNLNSPGSATKFIIESGSNIKYEILVIRNEDVFGIPKYQIFNPPQPVPCTKQKRIIIRYGSFWLYYKEYIIGFLIFIFMIFVRIYERSTRLKIDQLLINDLVPE